MTKKEKIRRRIRTWSMTLTLAAALLFLSAGLVTIDERVASVTLGDSNRTTLPYYNESGQTTGRILGYDYHFSLPSMDMLQDAGAWIAHFLPPPIRLSIMGIQEIGVWIPLMCENVWGIILD